MSDHAPTEGPDPRWAFHLTTADREALGEEHAARISAHLHRQAEEVRAALAERDQAMQAAALLRRWLRRLMGGGGDFAKAQAKEAVDRCEFIDDWLERRP